MKRLIKLSLVLVMTFMVTFFLFGCKKTPQEESLSRVTVDINPSIELLVDEENKVVSVTALNDDGNIIIDGRNCDTVSCQNRDIAMVFQNYALYPNMNVYNNIAFPLVNRREKKEVIKEKVITISYLYGNRY